MTRTEAWEKAWRLVAKEKDYSLVDEIYHPDYKAVSHMTGVEVNLEADKEAYLALIEHLIVAPAKIFNESEDFLCIQRYSKYREADIFCIFICFAVNTFNGNKFSCSLPIARNSFCQV